MTKKPLSDYPKLSNAVEAFIEGSANFENTKTINDVFTSAKKTTDYQSLFKVPISYKLFSMQDALSWLTFVQLATEQDTKGPNVSEFSAGHAFSVSSALDTIISVYDRSVEEMLDYFEDEEDDE
jgi:hypothetical protein